METRVSKDFDKNLNIGARGVGFTVVKHLDRGGGLGVVAAGCWWRVSGAPVVVEGSTAPEAL